MCANVNYKVCRSFFKIIVTSRTCIYIRKGALTYSRV